ncbi:MAG TPA: glycosyltransferase family 2 protein [Verrucomicrobiae bacterium]|nr:glycosyltransferase family 2 protein [Verrucomicrobiae bacterium]
MSQKKLISVVTPCYNEEENVRALSEAVRDVFAQLPDYDYEHIFIDNASKDKTVAILKEIAAKDPHVGIIVNARNFGHIRSPFYGLLQSRGEAAILLVADFQDPLDLMPEFIRRWEQGYKVVVGIKKGSEEAKPLFWLRQFYYRTVARLAEVELIKDFTGYGLYDRTVLEILRSVSDPYPYFRGLICDIGFEKSYVEYVQPLRKGGITKNNFYTLYDMAMLGMTNHSKVPLRLATMSGFVMSIFSMLCGAIYLAYKLLFWNSFSVGIAPLVIGLSFFASVQLFFLGIVGEYVGAIHTQILRRPLVIEKERVNLPPLPPGSRNTGA